MAQQMVILVNVQAHLSRMNILQFGDVEPIGKCQLGTFD